MNINIPLASVTFIVTFFFQYEVIVLPFYQKDSNAKQTDKKALDLSSTHGPLRRGRRPATSSMSAVPLPGGTGNHGSTASSAMLNALPIGKICPSERIPAARVGSYSPFLSKGTIVTVNLGVIRNGRQQRSVFFNGIYL